MKPACNHISPTSNLVPQTYDEMLYAECPKLDKQISVSELQKKLGLFSDFDDVRKQKWKNLSDYIHQLSKELDFGDHSVANVTEVSIKLKGSEFWKECRPELPAEAFIPALIYRERRNRVDRPAHKERKRVYRVYESTSI